MTTRAILLSLLAERKAWPKGSADWDYRSRACRRLWWIIRGVPVDRWPDNG